MGWFLVHWKLAIGLVVWFMMGLTGFGLYLSNPNTRPKKFSLLCVAFMTHFGFGLLALFYGYLCFSNRKIKVE